MGGLIVSILALVLLTVARLQASSEGPAQLVVDFSTEPESSYPSNFVSAGDVAFFAASGPAYSRGLWVTDGTASGTELLKADGAFYAPVVLARDDQLTALFIGFASELWTSDGTATGTVRLRRFDSLSTLTVGGDTAYFGELWQIPAAAIGGVCSGDCDGDFEVTVDEIVYTVTLALAGGEPATCAAADGGDDKRVTVDDILLGVTNLLGGCSSS